MKIKAKNWLWADGDLSAGFRLPSRPRRPAPDPPPTLSMPVPARSRPPPRWSRPPPRWSRRGPRWSRPPSRWSRRGPRWSRAGPTGSTGPRLIPGRSRCFTPAHRLRFARRSQNTGDQFLRPPHIPYEYRPGNRGDQIQNPSHFRCTSVSPSIRTSDRHPNGVGEVRLPEPGKTGRSSPSEGVLYRVTCAFRCARTAAPTCEYPLPEAARSTFLLLLSSPEMRPDLRKRHSEEAILVLPWIATEGVPVT